MKKRSWKFKILLAALWILLLIIIGFQVRHFLFYEAGE